MCVLRQVQNRAASPVPPATSFLSVQCLHGEAELSRCQAVADGTVEFRNEERVEFSHIVRSKHIGEQHIAADSQLSSRLQVQLRTDRTHVCSGSAPI